MSSTATAPGAALAQAVWSAQWSCPPPTGATTCKYGSPRPPSETTFPSSSSRTASAGRWTGTARSPTTGQPTDSFVVQPTHLDSTTLALAPDDPRTPRIWRYRIEDLVRVIDELARIEAAVPGLSGRVDRTRVAAAGHSWGATSASACSARACSARTALPART